MLGGAGHRARLSVGRVFGHPVCDEINSIIAGHVLFLKEVSGVAFPLGEDGDENVGTCDLGPAGGLNVDGRALNDALEGSGWHGLGTLDVGHQIAQILVDEFDKGIAQLVYIDRAGFHDLNGVGLVYQRQKQMLQRSEFVAPCIRKRERCVNGLL